MYKPKLRGALIALGMAALLSACGGNSGDDGAIGDGSGPGSGSAEAGVPSSATQSVSGLLAFMQVMLAGNSETDEPITVGEADFPTDDTSDI